MSWKVKESRSRYYLSISPIRTILVKDARIKEDRVINPQACNKGVFLAYRVSQELDGYNLFNVIRKIMCRILIHNS